MSQRIKYLPITKSELYRLGRRRDLATVLGEDLQVIEKITSGENYKEWTKKTDGKKDRLIEEPLPILSGVLSRLHQILSKVETPDYLMSGKKKIKPRDNAETHSNNSYMVNVDIESFYQSTKREFVYTAFRDTFGQANDVASLVADLVTYKGHIPTGTATSQLVAFWAYKRTFDRIDTLCKQKEIKMSVWVDDITFSSTKPFSESWVSDVQKIMKNVDLSLKPKKTKKYGANEFKTVTGSAISPDGNILVKNEKRYEILTMLGKRRVEQLDLAETRTLMGKLTSQRQNEPDFFSDMHIRCKKRLQKLERKQKGV